MNARLYDSAIGRFLSADTIIQDAHDTQAYNRYTYVRNNPLKYTDPSGHSWLSRLWNAIKSVAIPIITAVAAVYTAVAVLGAMGFSATAAATAGYANAFSFAMASGSAGATALLASGAAAGFTAGAVGALLNGGSLSQALRAGAQGAFFGAIGAGFAGAIGGLPLSGNLGKLVRASLHGITRAAIAKAQGGRYSGGFWSAFASSVMNPLIANAGNPQMRVTMALVVGGTASSLGGGKFANGAVSAAFVAMYNHMAHQVPGHRLHAPNSNPLTRFLDGVGSVFKGLYRFGEFLGEVSGFRDMQYGSVLGNLYQEAAFQRVRYTYETAEFIMTDPQARSLAIDLAGKYISENPYYFSGRIFTGISLSSASKAPFAIPVGATTGDVLHASEQIDNFVRGVILGY